MDKPLTKWYCDVCGKSIEDVKDGYVIWKHNDQLKDHSFKIIHQKICDLKDHSASNALAAFLGVEGETYLLSFLSLGSVKNNLDSSHCKADNLDEFVDFFRRMQTPFYEEARRRFGNSDLLNDLSDANEVYPYLTEKLKNIISNYEE